MLFSIGKGIPVLPTFKIFYPLFKQPQTKPRSYTNYKFKFCTGPPMELNRYFQISQKEKEFVKYFE